MIQAGLRACLCASLFAFAGAASAASSLTLVSAAGEPLGGGLGTRTFTTPVVTSNNSDTRSVDLEFAMPGETWRFEFMSPVKRSSSPPRAR